MYTCRLLNIYERHGVYVCACLVSFGHIRTYLCHKISLSTIISNLTLTVNGFADGSIGFFDFNCLLSDGFISFFRAAILN